MQMRAALLAVAITALTLFGVRCDRSCHEVAIHDGTPMKLTPDDGPFTKDRLIEIAYHYHPRIQHIHFATSDQEWAYRKSTPQWRAIDAAHDEWMTKERLTPWLEMVDVLDAELGDHYASDRTPWFLNEVAYLVELSPKDGPYYTIMGMVSGLVPMYFICENAGFRDPQWPYTPERVPAIERLEREIQKLYPGYVRLDHETAMTVVPDLQVGIIEYGETTLVDALFTSQW